MKLLVSGARCANDEKHIKECKIAFLLHISLNQTNHIFKSWL